MKLLVTNGETQANLTIIRDGAKLLAEIDDRKYSLEASKPENNIYLLKHENRVYEIFVSPSWKTGEPLTAKLAGVDYEVNIADPKSLRGAISSDGVSDGVVEIRTAMPGKVVKVLVETEGEVSKGDGVIVVEAMKMQNELKSPKNGTIKEVRFNKGDTVNAGDVLAVIE